MGAVPATALDRLFRNWVYGALPLALILLALTPTLAAGWPLAQTLVWLTLPAYMLHQYEEHDADRFRLFVNDMMGGPALSHSDVFWINVVGVWAVLAGVIWASRNMDPGWGVIAGWFVVINAAGHIVQAIALRRGNPGLWTAAVLFLPLGATILLLQTAAPSKHMAAVTLVLLLHGAIVLRARTNLRGASA